MARTATGIAMVLACSAAAGSMAAPRDATLPSEKDAWVAFRTPHLEVYTNGDVEQAVDMARSVEGLRGALGVRAGVDAGDPVPTVMFIFRGPDSFRPYQPRDADGRPQDWGGWCHSGHDQVSVALATGRHEAIPLVQHEAVHAFVGHRYPQTALWFEEGLAELYGHARRVGDHLELGHPPEHHLRTLAGERALPFDRLFAVGRDSDEYDEGVRRNAFYATAWALADYFMLARPDRGVQALRFLELRESGRGVEEAFAAAFSATPAELQAELMAYVRNARFPTVLVPAPAFEPSSVATRRVPRAEILTKLGEMVEATYPDRAADAEAHYRAAIAIDPTAGRAWSGLARLGERTADAGETEAAHRRAVELAPEDPRVRVAAGDWFSARESSDAGDRASWRAIAREHYAAAMAAPRAPVRALIGFGMTFSPAGPVEARLPEAVAALAEAHRLVPTRDDVTWQLAALVLRAGRPGAAAALVEPIARAGADVEPAARALLVAARVAEAEAHVAGGLRGAAIAAYEKALAAGPDDHFAADVRARVAALKATAGGAPSAGASAAR